MHTEFASCLKSHALPKAKYYLSLQYHCIQCQFLSKTLKPVFKADRQCCHILQYNLESSRKHGSQEMQEYLTHANASESTVHSESVFEVQLSMLNHSELLTGLRVFQSRILTD